MDNLRLIVAAGSYAKQALEWKKLLQHKHIPLLQFTHPGALAR